MATEKRKRIKECMKHARPHNRLVHRIVLSELSDASEKYARGRLVDIGCSTKPWKALFEPFVDEYIGVDHAKSQHNLQHVDVIADAYHTTLADHSFDTALCTAALEHLEEPEQALRECHRVLKRGGVAIYSVPFIWHLHEEPRDFFRFSKYGIRYLFEKVGFDIVELKALSGFWVTFGQLFVYNIYRFNRGPLHWLGIVPMIGLLVQRLAYLMDKVDKTEQWTWMYMVVARKR